MNSPLVAALAFLLALTLAYVLTPLAIRIALRGGFLDSPIDYKAHALPTPYLGGAAVWIAILLASLPLVGHVSGLGSLLICTGALWVIGTVDDRRTVRPLWRVLAEIIVAWVLYEEGFAWTLFGSGLPAFLLTAFWIVGLVNAFNLMDNLDGAAATVAVVSCCGITALALLHDQTPLAAISLAVCGACAGFLPYNLSRPSRIFLGDGGSMSLGVLVAGLLLLSLHSRRSGGVEVVTGALLVALPIIDTTLVVISRRRHGISILRPGRDHLTHRLLQRLHSPRRVASVLALGQLAICAVAILGHTLGKGAVAGEGAAGAVVALVFIAKIDSVPRSTRRIEGHSGTTVSRDHRRESGSMRPASQRQS